MQRLGMQEGESIEHPWVSRAIENAQRKVEGHNFDIRKQLLEYDDVANDQRKVIYSQRNELMESDDISETIRAIREDVIHQVIDGFIPPNTIEEQWDIAGLEETLDGEYGLKLDIGQWLKKDDNLHEENLRQKIVDTFDEAYRAKEQHAGSEVMRHFEKAVMLQVLDTQWKDHLATMDHLRQGIHLRGYAQKNPKQEYKREAFELFSAMLDRLKHEVVTILSKVHVRSEAEVRALEEQRRRSEERMQFQHAEASEVSQDTGDNEEGASTFVRNERKVGRNEPCPCGSGKKYKQCHGKLA